MHHLAPVPLQPSRRYHIHNPFSSANLRNRSWTAAQRNYRLADFQPCMHFWQRNWQRSNSPDSSQLSAAAGTSCCWRLLLTVQSFECLAVRGLTAEGFAWYTGWHITNGAILRMFNLLAGRVLSCTQRHQSQNKADNNSIPCLQQALLHHTKTPLLPTFWSSRASAAQKHAHTCVTWHHGDQPNTKQWAPIEAQLCPNAEAPS